MRDQDLSEVWGGHSLREVVEAIPSGSPPHLSEDALWALAAPEAVLPLGDRRQMFDHACNCRECFRVLMRFRDAQLRDADTGVPGGVGLDVWERWASLGVAFLIALRGGALELKARRFPMRMRDGAEVELTKVVLNPTQAFEIEFDEFTVALRLINADPTKNTMRLAVEIAAYPSDAHLDDLIVEVRRDGGEVVLSTPCVGGKVELGELPVSAYTLLLVNPGENQLIGSIQFTPGQS